MSVVEPEIDKLLELSENDRFLLCTLAAKRARDINNMMHGQRDRALALQSVEEVTALAGRKPLSIAMDEISDGQVSFDKESFSSSLEELNNY